MERIYEIPPEEYAEMPATEDEEPEFGIASDEAMVAHGRAACQQCQALIEVISIYCETGTDVLSGEPLRQFTVSGIWAMDEALAGQLVRWANFKAVVGDDAEGGFANHCPHCGAQQEEYLLHDEPGDLFFGISHTEPGALELSRLSGRIQLSGNYSFEV